LNLKSFGTCIRRALKGKACLSGAPFVPSVQAVLLAGGTVSRSEAWFRAVWWQEEIHWSLISERVVGAQQEWERAVAGWEGGLRQYCCGVREGRCAFTGCTTETQQSRIKIPVSK